MWFCLKRELKAFWQEGTEKKKVVVLVVIVIVVVAVVEVVKAMPLVKNPNFWKVEGKKRKQTRKRREREGKGFQ